MKFHVNILLKIVILATIVIPPETCQEQTSMNETLIDETSSNETLNETSNETLNETLDETSSNETSNKMLNEGPLLEVFPYTIFNFPDKTEEPCEEGQKKDINGNCRKKLST